MNPKFRIIPWINSPAEFLREVRKVLQDPEHWCKGKYFMNQEGKRRDVHDLDICRMCFQGGLWWVSNNATNQFDLNCVILVRDALERAILQLFPDRPYTLEGFNDTDDTTHDDVLKVMDRALELLEAER